MPCAGEHAVLHVAAHKRVTLMGAAVVAREHPARRAEQRDPLIGVSEGLRAAILEVIGRHCPHPVAHVRLLIVSFLWYQEAIS